MDNTRKHIVELIQERGFDFKSVSLALGRNHAYMNQFIHRGIPRKLSEDDRGKLSLILGVDEGELRHSATDTPRPRTLMDSASSAFQHARPYKSESAGDIVFKSSVKKHIAEERKLHKKAMVIAQEVLEGRHPNISFEEVNDLSWRMVDFVGQQKLADEKINAQLAEWLLTWED